MCNNAFIQRFSHLVVPHFKGIVNSPDPVSEGLLSGRNPDGKKLTELETYRLVQSSSSVELIQDVRRAMFAAALAVRRDAEGIEGVQLFSPEGCVHRVGNRAVRGAQMFREMWTGELLPSEVKSRLKAPVIEYYSDCTSREVARVLARLDEHGTAEVITDEYHVDRSQAIYDKRMGSDQDVIVASPEILLPEVSETEELPQTFRDLLRFVSATVTERLEQEGVNAKERADEKKYRVLQAMGRHVEEGLAWVLRRDGRLAKQLFPEGLSADARADLPPRMKISS